MALPRVLAGPIVRRVEPASCSFWVALSEQATVTARVWHGEKSAPVPDSDPAARRGPARHTRDRHRPAHRRRHRRHVRHAAAGGRALLVRPEVRARRRYDVRPARREAARGRGPSGADHQRRGRGSAASRPRLREGQAAVVPRPAVDVRADRSAHAGGGPAPRPRQLPAARQRRRRRARPVSPSSSRTTPTRPHQLHLTGDQIYADDVADAVPARSSPRSAAELTGAQSLPGFPPDPRTGGTGSTPVTGAGLPGTIANLPAMRRKWLLWQLAGFTGSDTQNHLITFPEFVAHYLLAWSPRVWRAVPTFADVFTTAAPPTRRSSRG